MVSDNQVKDLFKLMNKERSLKSAAHKAQMDEDTARKYLREGKLPSQLKASHKWQTRKDPFRLFWAEIEELLSVNPGLEAKTIFEHLQRKNPGQLQDGQLRTLQRKIKQWRATKGPEQEIYFEQVHYPGDLCASDFTSMNKLGITINHQSFPHLIYHFVLTYSNWEDGTVCFSESFESLSAGFQNAIWKLGGVPKRHQSDRMSAAFNNLVTRDQFTARYKALMNHYSIKKHAIQAAKPNENGDIEQRHYRFMRAVDQELMLRGSRNFDSKKEYEDFLSNLFHSLNQGRQQKLKKELDVLRRLPQRRLEDYKRMKVKVSRNSTIHLLHNIYSVPSRLIGSTVEAHIYADAIEVHYGGSLQVKMERLRGESKHLINYRHIIGSLIRKPGAFANYKFKSDLFPTTHFRIAYDLLKENYGLKADKEYLKILEYAAMETEEGVDRALNQLINREKPFEFGHVRLLVKSHNTKRDKRLTVRIDKVCLELYDKSCLTREKFKNASKEFREKQASRNLS